MAAKVKIHNLLNQVQSVNLLEEDENGRLVTVGCSLPRRGELEWDADRLGDEPAKKETRGLIRIERAKASVPKIAPVPAEKPSIRQEDSKDAEIVKIGS